MKKILDLCTMKNDGLSYQGSKVHKIIRGLLFEAGDLQRNIAFREYKETVCPIYTSPCERGDHLHAGTLSMLLEDDSSVSSKFSISLKKMPMLNGKEIVIGRVVKGLDVLSAIESYGSRFGLPRRTILIKSCGLVK